MTEQITEIVRLILGRGLRGEPYGDPEEQLELSVDLQDLGVELDLALADFEARRGAVWLPLTTTVSGSPVLVWDDNDSLIPTQVPVPPVGAEDRSPGSGTPAG